VAIERNHNAAALRFHLDTFLVNHYESVDSSVPTFLVGDFDDVPTSVPLENIRLSHTRYTAGLLRPAVCDSRPPLLEVELVGVAVATGAGLRAGNPAAGLQEYRAVSHHLGLDVH
jgi:hypothetical protein